ncbi:MAG: hypothetical protein QW314_03370 [Thermoproteota archaeon]|nr:hypothetical protein [Candidatus Brockarchaeota archaeon]
MNGDGFIDEGIIKLELSKLNNLKNDLEAIAKSKENNVSVEKEAVLLKRFLEKAILRRRIQLKLIALKKRMQLIEALNEKLYLFNKLYSRFLEENLRIEDSCSFSAEEIKKLPSSDEIKEKLYEIRAKYFELINNSLIEQEDIDKT